MQSKQSRERASRKKPGEEGEGRKEGGACSIEHGCEWFLKELCSGSEPWVANAEVLLV